MQVTPELLERYHRQLCTTAERAAVELWLQGDEPEEAQIDVDDEIKAAIWAGVQEHINSKKKRSFITKTGPIIRHYWHYAAAACVAFIVLLMRMQPSLLSESITISNNGVVSKSVMFNDIEFKVQPNSRCVVTVPIWGDKEVSMRFCGAVSIASTVESATVRIVTDDVDCNGKGTDMVKLYKGQTYMVMTDNDYNLIAATSKELQDGIPRLFSGRLSERFHL